MATDLKRRLTERNRLLREARAKTDAQLKKIHWKLLSLGPAQPELTAGLTSALSEFLEAERAVAVPASAPRGSK